MLTDTELEAIRRKLSARTGIDLSSYKSNFLQRKIAGRMFENHTDTFEEYFSLLDDSLEQQKLFMSLSINVTEFFRDPSLFEELQKNTFPALLSFKKQNSSRIIRIWSAGCASGEEPYSLAIILSEILKNNPEKFLLSITASDIDEKALQKAKQGLFPIYRTKNIKPEHLQKHFTKTNEKEYLINPELRENIRFLKHDLSHPIFPSSFDLIFCRNVPIYFSKEMQEVLFTKFYHALNRGGMLILGKSEALMTSIKDQFLMHNLSERIYRKI